MEGFLMANGLPVPALRAVLRLPERAFATSPWLLAGVTGIVLGAGAFLLHQLMAWPPHEDETLALFVGRDSFGGVIAHVTQERGGAPLHFLLAWALAHLGFGLGGLRFFSALFAIASLPLVALLGARLAGRRAALIATAIVATSWIFLFHGIYGRMYSLFLFLSLLSYHALLRALERGGRSWAWWVGVSLLGVAAHPYGALVLASQGLFVLVARRDRIVGAIGAFGVVGVLGIPFWVADLVLAGRFDVGVGGGGEKLGGPWAVATYLWRAAGDFSAGWWPVLPGVLAVGALGLRSLRPKARLFVLAVVATPTLAFLGARLGGSTAPESRHLIFALPFFAIAVAVGILRVTRGVPPLAPIAVGVLLLLEIAWAWQRTPPLFEWEPEARQAARADAEAWLAATSRQDDLLFGYEPLYLGAWERNRDFPRTVLPRADANLALRTLLHRPRPLGRAVWVLDASERNNLKPRLEIKVPLPEAAAAFETARFGPFLVVRTREPTGTPDGYLGWAAKAQVLGRSLGIGDADVNMLTVERADRALRGYGPSLRSRSTNSR
jgi:dolichyl-phosphate-mannose-protein mannosyltransferase